MKEYERNINFKNRENRGGSSNLHNYLKILTVRRILGKYF